MRILENYLKMEILKTEILENYLKIGVLKIRVLKIKF